MVASSAAARPSVIFDSLGPLQFTPPKEFDGDKENFEEFAFKLRACLFLMEGGYEKVCRTIEDNPDREDLDFDCINEEGDAEPELQRIAGQNQSLLLSSCTGPAAAMLRRDSTSRCVESWRRLYNR